MIFENHYILPHIHFLYGYGNLRARKVGIVSPNPRLFFVPQFRPNWNLNKKKEYQALIAERKATFPIELLSTQMTKMIE